MTYSDNDNDPLPGSSASICVAEVMTAHGIRGLVKLRCYLEDPSDLDQYNPLTSSDGQKWELLLKNSLKDDWIAEIKGIADRTAAEKLRGLKFYVARDQMPEPDANEYYYADLIGCRAILADSTAVGTVIAVENFGAGDLLEIRPLTGQSYYLPIAEPFVQVINIQAKTITVEPSEEFMNE